MHWVGNPKDDHRLRKSGFKSVVSESEWAREGHSKLLSIFQSVWDSRWVQICGHAPGLWGLQLCQHRTTRSM